MPWCKKCGRDYPEDSVTCDDCGRLLVNEQLDPVLRRPSRLDRAYRSFPGQMIASLLVGTLFLPLVSFLTWWPLVSLMDFLGLCSRSGMVAAEASELCITVSTACFAAGFMLCRTARWIHLAVAMLLPSGALTMAMLLDNGPIPADVYLLLFGLMPLTAGLCGRWGIELGNTGRWRYFGHLLLLNIIVFGSVLAVAHYYLTSTRST